jgi:hypothetical protein
MILEIAAIRREAMTAPARDALCGEEFAESMALLKRFALLRVQMSIAPPNWRAFPVEWPP